MRRLSIFASALLATVLFAIPLESQAFFFGFGSSFSFGFGGGGWWHPGYYGWGYPYYGYSYAYPYYGHGYHYPYYYRYHFSRPFLPYQPLVTAPATPKVEEK